MACWQILIWHSMLPGWRWVHPHSALPPGERRSFYVRDDYPSHLRSTVEHIYTSPGFFRDLPPIPGAIDAVGELLALGHDVRICTSPLNQYRHCVPEKYEWVERYFGSELVNSHMIVTKDKTLVHGPGAVWWTTNPKLRAHVSRSGCMWSMTSHTTGTSLERV